MHRRTVAIAVRSTPAAAVALLLHLALLAPAPVQGSGDPFVGDSRRQAEAAIAASAGQAPGSAMVALARRWLGRPYDAFSLDRPSSEQLRIDLRRFDCFLLVEQLLALVRSRSAAAMAAEVRQLRYDGGRISYCHRHHYFSRWTAAAEQRGVLHDISATLPGATSRPLRLTFMGRHPSSYRPMAQSANRACIQALERQLSVRQAYVPLAALRQVSPWLRDGDIFALVTRIPGLDVTHVGVLERSAGSLNGLHAAPGRGVMRSLDFPAYAARVPEVIGVAILRPVGSGTASR